MTAVDGNIDTFSMFHLKFVKPVFESIVYGLNGPKKWAHLPHPYQKRNVVSGLKYIVFKTENK